MFLQEHFSTLPRQEEALAGQPTPLELLAPLFGDKVTFAHASVKARMIF
jgi:hypothetical protein